MGFYRMKDGSWIHLSLSDPENPPTQERAQEIHDELQAQNATRNPKNVSYGKSVREKRLAMDLSIRELAQKCSMSPVDLSSIEKGRRAPTDIERQKIEAILESMSNDAGVEVGS